jgi:hypothetical protein
VGVKDKKKPPGLAGGFSCIRVLRVLSTLSIRQRSEMPKKVKIKLRGVHGDNDGGLRVKA